MKVVFLINNAHFLSEFFGKLVNEAVERQDDCLVVFSSKIAEYEKKKFFPAKAKFICAVDWYINDPNKNKEDSSGLPWKYFFPFFDRSGLPGIDYKKAVGLILQASHFFESIIAKERPDIIVSEPPAGLFHQIGQHLSKKNNVAYVGLGTSRMNNRIDIYDREPTFSRCKETFDGIESDSITSEEKEFAQNFIRDFISHKSLPSYMDSVKVLSSHIELTRHFLKRIQEVCGSFLRYLFARQKYKNFDYESEITLKRYIRALFTAERKKIRIFSQTNFFNYEPKKERFFLYPLHCQPEASTSVRATYYCNQLNTIENISFAIPFPYKLYVKEHPAAIGTRQNSFYEKLEKIPNVVLISSGKNTEELIKNSSGVITLTSTVGMEAALAGKPAYVLGDVFYSYHPLCRQVRNFDDLSEKINNDLANAPSLDNLEGINSRFIISYARNAISGNILSASAATDKNNYGLIYEEILKMLPRK